MKKVLLIAVTIVAVIALGNVLLVSAQGNSPSGQNGSCPVTGYTCPFSGTNSYRGMMGANGSAGANGMHEQVWTAVAKKLSMTYADLNAALQHGQTIAQLAQAKGVTLAELRTAALDVMQASFADLVKQGAMSQEQADRMLDHMDDMPLFNFDQGFGPGMMHGRGMMGPGMMGSGMMRGYQRPTGPQG